MARELNQILVVDLESTCWEGEPPPGQQSEIIEIGLCVLDVASLQRLEKCSMLVKPVRSEVSAFCTRLTTLTAEQLADADSLHDAVSTLRKEYRSQSRLWASWGDYDRRQFERVCSELGAPYPFGASHLNVKSLFAAALAAPREMGLDAAYARLGWKLEGTHHRGHDDAWNIAGVLAHLLKLQRTGLSSPAS